MHPRHRSSVSRGTARFGAPGRFVRSLGWGSLLSVTVLGAFLLVAPLAGAARGETLLVNRASGPSGAAADGSSGYISISADGRYVAFGSDADNLSAEDNNAYRNIFLRDAQSVETRLQRLPKHGGVLRA